MRVKVTKQVFEEAKTQLTYKQLIDVAQSMNLSYAMVQFINNAEDYDDFLIQRQERLHNPPRLKNSLVSELSGEPLFWEINRNLRSVPAKYIATRKKLPLAEIALMKKATSYEEYLNLKATQVSEKDKQFRSGPQEKLRREIIERYNQGDNVKYLAELYGYPEEKILSLLATKEKRQRKERKTTNSAIAEIILAGIESEVPKTVIASTMGVSYSTIMRIGAKARAAGGREILRTDATKTKWQNKCLSKKDRVFYKQGEDFYMFSLRKYLGLDHYPFWWDKSEGKTETTQVVEAEATTETGTETEPMANGLAETINDDEKPVKAVEEKTEAVDPIETSTEASFEINPEATTEVRVPVQIERNGQSLALNINITLNL